MSFANFFQWIGMLGIGNFYPIQNWRAIVSRKPVGLSFFGFCVLAVGVFAYVLLGIQLQTPIYTLINIFALVFDLSLLVLMWWKSPALSYKERALGFAILVSGIGALLFINSLSASTAVQFLGWIGFTGTIAFYPIQNLQIFIKKDTTGLSLTAFIALLIGVVGLTIFGFLIGDKPIFLGNLLSAIGTLGIIYGILRWRK